jgi:hypothetical protein
VDYEHEWQKSYHAVVLETDWLKMPERIRDAEVAIKARLHEFSLNHGGTPEENQAIQSALRALEVIRNDVAFWRDSQRSA